MLEARVEGRNEYVEVHVEITQATNELVSDICFSEMTVATVNAASVKSLQRYCVKANVTRNVKLFKMLSRNCTYQ